MNASINVQNESRGATILVVDDDPGILRAVARVLGKRHRVATAATGAEALEVAATTLPDLAVVDIRLPETTGFEVTRALKTTLPDVDVILMTGNAEEPDENLIRAIAEGAFYFIEKPFDRRVLLALVDRCLDLRRLRQERELYLERVARELSDARQFQLSLLPPPALALPGAALAARYLACSELAGDFYDYAVTEEGGVALVVADVVGHGAAAALLTALVKSAFRGSASDDFAPLAVVERIRDSLREFDAGRFLTVCSSRWNPSIGMLSYVNAGHPEPLARRTGGGTVALDPTGPLLSSALCDIPCHEASVALHPGDSVLFHTDGLFEVRGADGLYGQKRLAEALARLGLRGGPLLDALLAEVAHYAGTTERQDDVTLVVLDIDSP